MFAIVIRENAQVISYSIDNSKEIDSNNNTSICGVESYEQGRKISLVYNRMRELGIKVNVANIYRACKNKR